MTDSIVDPDSIASIPAEHRQVYAFEDFELHTPTLELFRSGRPCELQLKPAKLLLYLIEQRERVVPKGELLKLRRPFVLGNMLQRQNRCHIPRTPGAKAGCFCSFA